MSNGTTSNMINSQQALVNAQVEVGRAVWAMNHARDDPFGVTMEGKKPKEYIHVCIDAAIAELQKAKNCLLCVKKLNNIKEVNKMKNILLVLLVLLVMLVTNIANAIEATVSGTSVTLSYTEPVINEDSSVLTDLDHTSIYYDIGSGFVKAVDVPATAATGGGQITNNITVPVTPGMEVNAEFKATATDTGGNESKDSNIVTKRIDRLSPAAPK